MAAGRRKSAPTSSGGLKSASAPSSLPVLETFLLNGHGQVAIGAIGPVRCAAVASGRHQMLAALVRRSGETLAQLLERLEEALQLALEQQIFTDEINRPR